MSVVSSTTAMCGRPLLRTRRPTPTDSALRPDRVSPAAPCARSVAEVLELQGDAQVGTLQQGAITACRSSRFLPVTRTVSPWVCCSRPWGPSP